MNILHFLFILFTIYSFSYQKSKVFLIKNLNAEIHLIVKGTGYTNIFDFDENFIYYPTTTKINGVIQEENDYAYYFDEEENEVTLIWNHEFTNASYMFYYADSITEINFINFDFSNINDMTGMFQNCYNLTSIKGLNNIDTKNVISMNRIFYKCIKLESLDLTSFNTASLKDMMGMFAACFSLTSINLNSFDTSKVTDMSFLFYHCHYLDSIELSYFNTSSVETMESMFEGCISLKSINLNNFDTSKVKSLIDLFNDCEDLEIADISKFNTSSVVDIKRMFYNCKSLKSIDLSGWETSKIKDMYSLFFNCKILISINLSNFKTSSVEDICAMFCDCYSLESVDLSSFDTSKVTDISFLFYGCHHLKTINLSNFITTNVEDMRSMFSYCYSLISVDLSNFNTSNVYDMKFMFEDAYELTSVNLNSFNTKKVTSFYAMFAHCTKLKFINLYSFTINEEADIDRMVYNTSLSLKYCYNIDTANILGDYLDPDEMNCSISLICSEPQKDKYIKEKNKCIDKCKNDNYEYEYDKGCYHQCPKNTYIYNNEKCFDTIPNGYYLVNGYNIDKCDESCLTCEGKGTSENSNCKTCPSEKYYNLGNCVSNCINGNYNEEGINKCYCDLEKCLLCSLESLKNDLCITCNNNDGYYKKYESSNFNDYLNCYQSLDGYYLDKNENAFKQCYDTCETREAKGNENNHNCKTCQQNFYFYDNSTNCYQKCDNYYYFDNNNKFQCTKELNCPDGYNLISPKKKCVIDCSNEVNYQYEYNKECYSKCPTGTKQSKGFMCENIIICEKYYNYEQTACLEKIPDGYYLSDPNLKTIDICHEDCLTCEKKATNNNSNCKSCPEGKYLYYGNCTSNCPNNYYKDIYDNNIQKCKCENPECLSCPLENVNICYNCSENYYPKENDNLNNGITKKCYKDPKYYYLDKSSQMYKPCYNTCETCDKYGDNKNNNCKTCKENYIFRNDFSNDNNCYEKCSFYYYFDNDKNHFCTNKYECPNSYKLIQEKGKCINDCCKDNIYKYEFRKKCLEKCPENTKVQNIDFYCEIECPKESPYELIENQTCIKNCSKS